MLVCKVVKVERTSASCLLTAGAAAKTEEVKMRAAVKMRKSMMTVVGKTGDVAVVTGGTRVSMTLFLYAIGSRAPQISQT